MFDFVSLPDPGGPARLEVDAAGIPPTERMILHKRVPDALRSVRRFAVRGVEAQVRAARLALGLGGSDAPEGTVTEEALADHLFKFYGAWPVSLGLRLRRAPRGDADRWQALRRDLFGPAGAPPDTPAALEGFLSGSAWAGVVLSAIGRIFPPGVAVTGGLPTASRTTAFTAEPVENSCAARHALHPVMRHLAKTHGRGPLWRAMGHVYDIAALIDDRFPVAAVPAPGEALVHGAQGVFACTAGTKRGHVTCFEMITPTRQIAARGGALDQSLASLPPEMVGRAALLVGLFDPCTPLRLRVAA